jgi:hypothetical protein
MSTVAKENTVNAGDAGASSPVAKKAKSDDSNKPKTPYQLYFDEMKAFRTENGFKGQLLTKGIASDRDDEEESDEEDEADNSKYTTEQMQTLRFIMINDSRADQLDAMRKLVLGDQADEGFMMFNTSFSWQIMDHVFPRFKQLYQKTTSKAKKFDMLFAFTFQLFQYDVWCHDNEDSMNPLTSGLAKMWKALLKGSNEELGIDAKYTRPGIMALLEDFKKLILEVGDCQHEPKMKFNYK